MPRLVNALACCLLGLLLSFQFVACHKAREYHEEESEEIENPDAHPVTKINISAAVPFSNRLVNYTNTGLMSQAGAVNAVVVSYADSNLVLAGAQNGGVWISHDCAHTWSPVNDTARTLCVTSLIQNPYRPNEFYYSTGVDITINNQHLFDVYHSTDYGQTFSVVHPTTGTAFGRVDKLVALPTDSNTLYALHNSPIGGATVYRTTNNCNSFQLVYQTPDEIDDIVVLPNGTVELGYLHQVWRSPSGNLGTFVQSTGITTGYTTRIAYCRSQPNIQYCAVNIYAGYDVYKSTDSGQTWTLVGNVDGGRRIAVKPDDPDFLFAGNVHGNYSLDGGVTWQYSWGGHDLRSYNFDPNRIGKVWVTSDFGVATLEVDPLTSTSFTQEYRQDSTLYSQEAYYGDYNATGIQSLQGYQDLGTRLIQSTSSFRTLTAGDGTWCWISKQNPATGYFSTYGGDMSRSYQMTTTGLGVVYIMNQLDTNHDLNIDEGSMFNHPFIMNNSDDAQLYFPTFHHLWRSLDHGDNWMIISDYYRNQYGDITIDCNHKPNPNIYWTNSDTLFTLQNAATAAPSSEVGRPAPFDAGRCYVDPDNDSMVYLINRQSVSSIKYCSNVFNPASTWSSIPLTMLSGLTIQCIAVYPGNNNIILAGTKEGGLYVTMDRGLTWTKEGNFPNVQITEIKIRPSDKKVFIFTYGRGTWTADFASMVGVESVSNTINVKVYPNPFKDYMTIDFDKEIKGIVVLTDMQGKKCLERSVSGKQIKIDTEHLSSGNYIITVTGAGKIIYKGKVLKIADRI